MFNNKVSKTLIALFLCSAAFNASASLIGDSVVTSYTGSGGSSNSVNSIVGVGEEGNFFGNQFFDYDDFTFDIRSTSDFCGIYACSNATVTLGLSDLNFSTGILTGVTFDTNLTGVAMDFGADFVNFTWDEQAITTGTYLSATFSTVSVPEPTTLALMSLGLIGFGVARRKQS